MVFQSYALWPHMTVAKNLALPLNIRKVPKDKQKVLISEALDKVGLADLSGRYPHQLSGGQQQRVALARALVYSPTVLLLDEPLSNLDAKLREQARAWLKRLQEDLGITTVYVTHDQDEALALSDRIAVMAGGNMIQIGSPHEIYESPAAPEVAAFIGRCNFLTGRVLTHAGSSYSIRLDTSGDVVEVESEQDVGRRPRRHRRHPPRAAGGHAPRIGPGRPEPTQDRGADQLVRRFALRVRPPPRLRRWSRSSAIAAAWPARPSSCSSPATRCSTPSRSSSPTKSATF